MNIRNKIELTHIQEDDWFMLEIINKRVGNVIKNQCDNVIRINKIKVNYSDFPIIGEHYTISFSLRIKEYIGFSDVHKEYTERFNININDSELKSLRRKFKINNILREDDN